jgi:exosortase H (IPTLxxWG-CTERM-specific)
MNHRPVPPPEADLPRMRRLDWRLHGARSLWLIDCAIRYPAHDTRRRCGVTRFLTLFIVLLASLFAIEMLQPVQQHVVLPWTSLLADASGWLMRLFDDQVSVSGKIISSTVKPFSVSIEPGCNGVEAMIVLLAAMMAVRAPLLYRITGLLAGFVAIQGLNLVRIISLYYLGLWDREIFEWAHLYVWQALIILDSLVVFLAWAHFLPAASQTDVVGA